MRILVADDHAVVRKGLVQIVGEMDGVTQVDEATDGDEAVDLVRKSDYDIVIMDISMPGRSGLDAMKTIKADKPSQAILILSMYDEKHYAIRVLRAGGSGYLTKDAAPTELQNAITVVLKGGKYVSPGAAGLLIGPATGDGSPPHEALSDRELEVMRLLASGKSVGEIGREMSLSVKSISTYRKRVLTKMGMASNADLAIYAANNGLVG